MAHLKTGTRLGGLKGISFVIVKLPLFKWKKVSGLSTLLRTRFRWNDEISKLQNLETGFPQIDPVELVATTAGGS